MTDYDDYPKAHPECSCSEDEEPRCCFGQRASVIERSSLSGIVGTSRRRSSRRTSTGTQHCFTSSDAKSRSWNTEVTTEKNFAVKCTPFFAAFVWKAFEPGHSWNKVSWAPFALLDLPSSDCLSSSPVIYNISFKMLKRELTKGCSVPEDRRRLTWESMLWLLDHTCREPPGGWMSFGSPVSARTAPPPPPRGLPLSHQRPPCVVDLTNEPFPAGPAHQSPPGDDVLLPQGPAGKQAQNICVIRMKGHILFAGTLVITAVLKRCLGKYSNAFISNMS